MVKRVWKIVKVLLLSTGTLAALMIILALTTAPFWTWYGLGTKYSGIHRPPDYIVLMGGGGMPSESGLIRCYYTAIAGNYFTRSKIIVALPGNITDSLSSIQLIKKELILHGIAPERIMLEDSGTNTRAQAINILKLITNDKLQMTNLLSPIINDNSSFVICHSSLLVVTSPEHLYRAVKTFRKAGFIKVDGIPAFEQALESDITFNARKLGGSKLIPDVGENIALRYQFWSQMNYEFLVIREWLALTYYWLMGWI